MGADQLVREAHSGAELVTFHWCDKTADKGSLRKEGSRSEPAYLFGYGSTQMEDRNLKPGKGMFTHETPYCQKKRLPPLIPRLTCS